MADQSIRAELSTFREWFQNAARRGPESHLLPESEDADAARKNAETVARVVADDVERLTEGGFAERQARTYVLSTAGYDAGAIALFLSLLEDGHVTEPAVREDIEETQARIDAARETLDAVGAVDDDAGVPVFLDRTTAQRLRRRTDSRQQDLSTVVETLLDGTMTSVPIRTFVESYLSERDVVKLAVTAASLDDGPLSFVVHVAVPESDRPHRGVDAVDVDGTTVEFTVEETNMGPTEHETITLYARDDLPWLDGVSVDDGLDTLRRDLDGRA